MPTVDYHVEGVLNELARARTEKPAPETGFALEVQTAPKSNQRCGTCRWFRYSETGPKGQPRRSGPAKCTWRVPDGLITWPSAALDQYGRPPIMAFANRTGPKLGANCKCWEKRGK